MSVLQNNFGKVLQGDYGIFDLINKNTYRVIASDGSSIEDVIAETTSAARELKSAIQFEFKGVTVTVRANSNHTLIKRDWLRASKGCIWNNVGPKPAPVLTDKEKTNDKSAEINNRRRQLEWEVASLPYRGTTANGLLKPIMRIELRDGAASKRLDYYSSCGDSKVIGYAERWAHLMRWEMAEDKKINDMAKKTSYQANTDGIDGSRYFSAVKILVSCWRYGDSLRRWYLSA